MRRISEKAKEDQRQFREEIDRLNQIVEHVMELEKRLDRIRVAAAEVELEMLQFKQKDMGEKMTLFGATDYILENLEGIIAQRLGGMP